MRRWLPWALAGGLAVGYVAVGRPLHLRWGVSARDARRPLPGDDLVAHPMTRATRGLRIAAPPERVWPWLVQMGRRQGGFYSYDLLDNDGLPSAREILPEYQDRRVGDEIPLEEGVSARIMHLEPGRALVWALLDKPVEMGLRCDLSMAFVLEPLAGGGTLLLCRVRGSVRPGVLAWLYGYLLFEPVDFLMMRRQLLGIRERAEGA